MRSVIVEAMPGFLSGNTPALIQVFEERQEQFGAAHHFQKNLWQSDLETLRAFYRFGPERNCRLRERAKIEGNIILQEELDDLLVTANHGAGEL